MKRKNDNLEKIKLYLKSENKTSFKILSILGLLMIFIIVIMMGSKYSNNIQIKNKQLISKLETIDDGEKEETKVDKENEKIKKEEEKLKLEEELNLIKSEIMELDEEVDLEYTTNSIVSDIEYYKEILENIKLESELENGYIEDINEDTQTNIEPNIPVAPEPVVTPPVEETPVITPPVEETPVVTPPVEETPVVTPPMEETPVVTPPVEEPPAEEIPIDPEGPEVIE